MARTCDDNYAKYAAIRAYYAEMGTVQGSEGIQYEAVQSHLNGDISKYSVVISDNNEDGDVWEVNYQVVLKQVGEKCRILSVETRK